MENIFEKCGEATAFLKLLANPNRLAVLCCLVERQHNVTELTEKVGIPQAAMSNQLTLLREAGIIDCKINHRERIYSITDHKTKEMIKLLHSFFCE